MIMKTHDLDEGYHAYLSHDHCPRKQKDDLRIKDQEEDRKEVIPDIEL